MHTIHKLISLVCTASPGFTVLKGKLRVRVHVKGHVLAFIYSLQDIKLHRITQYDLMSFILNQKAKKKCENMTFTSFMIIIIIIIYLFVLDLIQKINKTPSFKLKCIFLLFMKQNDRHFNSYWSNKVMLAGLLLRFSTQADSIRLLVAYIITEIGVTGDTPSIFTP